MVWNSAGSTLYKAVERHNNGTAAEKQHFSPASVQHEQHHNEAPHTESRCQHEPVHCPKCASAPKHSGIEALLQDKDFVLLAGLILLLMHEKADSKLILALAFVLFG